MACELQLVDDPAGFAGLQEEWTDLLARSPNASVTLTFDWLQTWWQVYGAGRSLRIITARVDGRLAGVAPLLLRTQKQRRLRLIPYRRIELLASGEAPPDAICSDYIGWICEDGLEAEFATAVLTLLSTRLRSEWDEVTLQDLAADAAMTAAVTAAGSRLGFVVEETAREASAYIRLPSTWEEYLASRSSSFRYKLKRGMRDFEKEGGQYRVVTDAAGLPAAFSSLVTLHTARWNARGEPGAFASPLRLAFHTRLLPIALKRGWLRLGMLTLKDVVIGAVYSFRFQGRVYFYQSGIAPQDSSHLRPGALLHCYEIAAAIADGYAEYDFLKGGSDGYKEDWANAQRDLVDLRMTRNGPRQWLLAGLRKLQQSVRRR